MYILEIRLSKTILFNFYSSHEKCTDKELASLEIGRQMELDQSMSEQTSGLSDSVISLFCPVAFDR